jgi:hypothetical protein
LRKEFFSYVKILVIIFLLLNNSENPLRNGKAKPHRAEAQSDIIGTVKPARIP